MKASRLGDWLLLPPSRAAAAATAFRAPTPRVGARPESTDQGFTTFSNTLFGDSSDSEATVGAPLAGGDVPHEVASCLDDLKAILTPGTQVPLPDGQFISITSGIAANMRPILRDLEAHKVALALLSGLPFSSREAAPSSGSAQAPDDASRRRVLRSCLQFLQVGWDLAVIVLVCLHDRGHLPGFY